MDRKPEKPASLDEKRFGWQMAESVATFKLRCLELALTTPRIVVGREADDHRWQDPIAYADRMARFVLGQLPSEDDKQEGA